MAKRLIISLIICSFFLTPSFKQAKEAIPAKQPQKQLYDPEMDCTRKVRLTWAQQKKLREIYYKIHRDYSELIMAYSQAGALTPYQAKVRANMLNNYIKTFYQRSYQWCSEHEADEWEEEWYNSDND